MRAVQWIALALLAGCSAQADPPPATAREAQPTVMLSISTTARRGEVQRFYDADAQVTCYVYVGYGVSCLQARFMLTW